MSMAVGTVLGPRVDVTGQRFGRLTALKVLEYRTGGYRWLFRCDCGTETITTVTKAKSGHTSSCGCLHRERFRMASVKHGFAAAANRDGKGDARLYRIWKAMRYRCFIPTCKVWKHYGGRGITICPQWEDFAAFRVWSLDHGYSDILTIDRINNDGNYEPDNCRWTTMKVQSNNTRRQSRRVA